jgi:hypothetical protein
MVISNPILIEQTQRDLLSNQQDFPHPQMKRRLHSFFPYLFLVLVSVAAYQIISTAIKLPLREETILSENIYSIRQLLIVMVESIG